MSEDQSVSRGVSSLHSRRYPRRRRPIRMLHCWDGKAGDLGLRPSLVRCGLRWRSVVVVGSGRVVNNCDEGGGTSTVGVKLSTKSFFHGVRVVWRV